MVSLQALTSPCIIIRTENKTGIKERKQSWRLQELNMWKMVVA